ncbi:MAG: hypothetical protein DWQ02_20655 [Bacteroidetes bacterium]|nr:MAG: hypothetical protein DWQ02_20655 [Bacteroidota bacterium]
MKDGFRVQLTQSEISQKMDHITNLSSNQVQTLLDGMLESGLLRKTPADLFELANNFIARKAHEKIEAENRVLRTIKNTIQDRMSRNQLLDETYLNYITPSLNQLELTSEERKFIRSSEDAVRRRKRLINLALTALFILMAVFLIGAVYNSRQVQKNAAAIQKKNQELQVARDSITKALKEVTEAQVLADSLRKDAEQKTVIALQARDTAEMLRRKAIADRDSISALRQAALALASERDKLRKQAEEKAKEEQELRKLAEKNEARADSLYDRSKQLNKIITSRIAATRSLQIEDTHMRSLIALEAYRINKHNEEVGDIYHPNIVKALYSAVSATKEDFFRSKEIIGSVKDIVISPNGEAFYTAGSDGKVRKWTIQGNWNDVQLGKPKVKVDTLGAQGGGVHNTIALSPNGRLLLVGGGIGNFQILDTQSGRLLSTYSLPHIGERIYDCAFDDEGNFCGMGMNYAYFWFEGILGDVEQKHFRFRRNTEDRSPLISIKKLPSSVSLIRRVDGEFIPYSVEANYDGYAFMINTQKLDGEKNIIEEYPIDFGSTSDYNHGNLTAMDFYQYDEQNGLMVYGFSSGKIIFMPVDELHIDNDPFFGSGKNIFKPHQASISTMTFSDDGRHLAVASYDGSVSVWNLDKLQDASYQPMIFDDMSSWAMTVAFANDNKTLITGCRDGSIYFWNTNPDDYAQYLCSHLEDTKEVFIAQQKELNERQKKTGVLGIRHNELRKSTYIMFFGEMEDPDMAKVNVCDR